MPFERRPLRILPLFLATVIGLGVTLQAPLATTVIGLMVFGVLHNLFELRYLAARFVVGRLSVKTAWLIAAPIIAVVAVRAFSGELIDPMVARKAEIVLVYASLALAALSARAPTGLRIGLCAVSIVAGLASLQWVAAHYLILVHLHNLMPIPFLLLHCPENRRAVLWVCGVWAVAVPAMLLSGALDPVLDFSAAYAAGPVDVEEAALLRSSWAPPATQPDQVTRIAATFSFLQWMHYFIWIFYLPRFTAPPRTTGRIWGLFFGPVGFGAALLVTLALVPVYISDYLQAFRMYATLAAFHALVEFPVLLAFLLSPGLLAEARPDELELPRDAAL